MIVAPGVVRNNGKATLDFEVEYFEYVPGQISPEVPFTYWPMLHSLTRSHSISLALAHTVVLTVAF